MSKNHSKWAVSFVLILAFCTSLHAQRGRWTYLGDSHVDGSVDHDSIRVGRSGGAFRAIQLRISGGAINFERVVVRYGDGTQDEIPIRPAFQTADKRESSICRVSAASSRALTSGTAGANGEGGPKSASTEFAELKPNNLKP